MRFFGLVAVSLLLRIYILFIPILDVDESVFGTFASVLLHGGLPYADAIDNKPPLVYLLYYLVWLFFGEHNMLAIRLITSVWIAATAWVLGRISTKLFSEESFYVTALIYTTATTLGEPKYLASNVNIFAALPISLSFYLFLSASADDKWWKWFLIGASAAVSMLFRYQAGFMFIVISVCLAIKEGRLLDKLRSFFLMILGLTAVFILLSLIFLRIGIFYDFVNWSLIYGLKYAAQGEVFYFWPRFYENTLAFLVNVLPLIIMAVCGFYAVYRDKRFDRGFLYIVIWFALAWWPVCLGRRFYSHYYLILLPPLSLMAGYGLLQIRKKFFRNVLVLMLSVWVLVFFFIRIEPLGLTRLFKVSVSDWSEVRSLEHKVGEYIKKRTRPDDRIFVWGFAAPVYFCSDRLPASRFIVVDPLAERISGGYKYRKKEGASHRGISNDYWDILFDDLGKSRPVYIVDFSHAYYGGFHGIHLEEFPLYEWMNGRGYYLEDVIQEVRIYRMRL